MAVTGAVGHGRESVCQVSGSSGQGKQENSSSAARFGARDGLSGAASVAVRAAPAAQRRQRGRPSSTIRHAHAEAAVRAGSGPPAPMAFRHRPQP